jgi:hypothetical protein
LFCQRFFQAALVFRARNFKNAELLQVLVDKLRIQQFEPLLP